MAERSWFLASQGKPQGPYPEAQLREFLAAGTVTAETLVWTEGMVGWQKAGEIPGLVSGASRPPGLPPTGAPLTTGGAANAQSLSMEFSIWALLGRELLVAIGSALVIPSPWTTTSFCRWFIEHLRVPQRPDLGFTGKPGDIWYVFVIEGLCAYAGFADASYLPLLVIPLQAYLSWIAVRWIAVNISSEGRQLPFSLRAAPGPSSAGTCWRTFRSSPSSAGRGCLLRG